MIGYPRVEHGAILPVFFFHIINLLLTKLVRSRWVHISASFFFRVLVDLDFVSVHKHPKKRTWPRSSHLTLCWPATQRACSQTYLHAWSITHRYKMLGTRTVSCRAALRSLITSFALACVRAQSLANFRPADVIP